VARRPGALGEENPDDDSCAYSDGVELIIFCPDCAEHEFGG
jgi:hypothetical protein